jgi:large subunit ribosomal protein L18
MKIKSRKQSQILRHKRLRKKVEGTPERLRLCVTKTNKHIFAQIIDDTSFKTLVSSSTVQLKKDNNNIESSSLVGADIAKKALEKKITKVVFDTGGSKYHGKIKAVADAARKEGLDF